METPLRKCTRCHEKFPATNEYFRTSRDGKYGLRSTCKQCQIEYNREYVKKNTEQVARKRREFYLKNRDRILTEQKEYNKRNAEKIRRRKREYYRKHSTESRERHQKYYLEHRSQILEKAHEYAQRNAEKLSQRRKEYYQRNKERLNKASQRRYFENRPKMLQQRRDYYLKNRERLSAKGKEWASENLALVKLYKQRYRARKREAKISDFNIECWLNSQKPFRCYLCGRKIKDDDFHIEHRIPLSRGGVHAPFNLGIACPRCNHEKNLKMPWEYRPDKFQPELLLGARI